METSKFAGLAGKTFGFAKLGAKTSDETRPELIATTAPNKFQINRLGSSLLKLQTGDRVKMIVDDAAKSVDEMFYLVVAAAKDKSGALLASVGKKPGIGKSLVFNFSGVWSKMVQNDVKATELSPAALVRMGLAIERMTTPMKDENGVVGESKSVYAAKSKTFCEIVDTEIDMVIEEQSYRLFALTNIQIEEVTEDAVADDENAEGDDD